MYLIKFKKTQNGASTKMWLRTTFIVPMCLCVGDRERDEEKME